MMGRKMTVMMVKGKNIVVADTQDTQICDEMENSQSSDGNSSQSSNNRVTTTSPLTPSRRPAPGKRMCYGPKKDAIEDKLLQIIKKTGKKMKMKCFVIVLLPF